jgi:hypothetical protein
VRRRRHSPQGFLAGLVAPACCDLNLPTGMVQKTALSDKYNVLANGEDWKLYRHSQLDRIVWSMDQVLLGAEMPFGSLHRCVSQQ